MLACRRLLQNVGACSRKAIFVSSLKLTRNTQTLCKQNSPVLYKFSTSFSTSTPTLDKAGVVVNIQDADDFKTRVMESEIPVVVDFHAEWCGPCKVLGPRIEKLVDSKEGKVLLAKVDIDELGDLAVYFGVKAVPTVLAVKDGKIVDEFVGNADDDVIKSFLNKLVSD